jgi:hypothetical protein
MPNASDTKDRSGNGFHGTVGGTLETSNDFPVLSELSDELSGIRMLPAGITALAQHIIPRYANGTKHPSGELRGWGAKSILAATHSTRLQANPAIVVTEGNQNSTPDDISEWQAGSTNATQPAVLQPTLANCTVIGYIDNYDWTQTGDVNDQPRVYNIPVSSHPDKYAGADLCWERRHGLECWLFRHPRNHAGPKMANRWRRPPMALTPFFLRLAHACWFPLFRKCSRCFLAAVS